MSDAQSSAGAGSVPAPAVASAGTGTGPATPALAAAPSAPASPDDPVPRPRLATPADVPEILRLVRELAEYERALPEVVATPELLTALLFGSGSGPLPGPVAACHVIDADPPDDPATGAPRLAALALWFRNASTWLAVPGIYLEDLYVTPACRGRGYGRTLLATLAALCVEHGYGRLEWSVLDWNVDAIGFYRSLGAGPMDEWTVHRVTGPELAALAARAAPAIQAQAGAQTPDQAGAQAPIRAGHEPS